MHSVCLLFQVTLNQEFGAIQVSQWGIAALWPEFKLLLGSKPSSDVGQAGLDHLDISERVSIEAKEVAEKFLDGQGVSIDDIDTLQC